MLLTPSVNASVVASTILGAELDVLLVPAEIALVVSVVESILVVVVVCGTFIVTLAMDSADLNPMSDNPADVDRLELSPAEAISFENLLFARLAEIVASSNDTA